LVAGLVADLVAVLVVPELAVESADVEEDELPDSLEGVEALFVPESLPDPWWLPVLRREPFRESLRESLR
jgi:hypothetical protein